MPAFESFEGEGGGGESGGTGEHGIDPGVFDHVSSGADASRAINEEGAARTQADIERVAEENVQAAESALTVEIEAQIKRGSSKPDTKAPTAENLQELNSAAEKLTEGADSTGRLVDNLDATASSFDPQASASIEAAMRPIFDSISSSFADLVERVAGKGASEALSDAQSEVTEAIKERNPTKLDEKLADLDRVVEEKLSEVDKQMKEKSNGEADASTFAKIKAFLEVAGFIGLLAFLGAMFFMDNGCWKYQGGAKVQKLTFFDFSKDNNQNYCSCSDNSVLETPTPLSDWCPAGKNQGDPTWVTCPPYKEPGCTVSADNPKGIFYSYYVASPVGVFNTIVNQAGKTFNDAANWLKDAARWGSVISCVLLAIYCLFQAIVWKIEYYYIGAVVMIAAAIACWYLLPSSDSS